MTTAVASGVLVDTMIRWTKVSAINAANIDDVYHAYEEMFGLWFGAPLSMFWDRAHGGFLLRQFITQILGYDGPEPWVRCREMFGQTGVNVITGIMGSTQRLWQ